MIKKCKNLLYVYNDFMKSDIKLFILLFLDFVNILCFVR